MTELYETDTRLEAWAEAATSVLEEGQKQNIILHIESPTRVHEKEQDLFEKLNQHYKQAEKEPIHTVAEWIFPGWLYRREGLEGVFENYPDQLRLIKQKSRGARWGTYFGRMIERQDPKTGETFNPLENLIEKLKSANHPDGQTYHSCYELNLHDLSLDIPLYDPAQDRNRRRNLACLAHLSFKLYDGEIHLTAYYRSHDYRYKVPGNLLGLARLQSCVAKEVDVNIGNLVVHSSRAMIPDGNDKSEFRRIVKNTYRGIKNKDFSEFS